MVDPLLYHFIFEQSLLPVAIIEGDDYIFTFVNPELSKTFYGRQLLGKQIFKEIPELKENIFHSLLVNSIKADSVTKANEVPLYLDVDKRIVLKYFNIVIAPTVNTFPIKIAIYMQDVSDRVYQEKLGVDWAIAN